MDVPDVERVLWVPDQRVRRPATVVPPTPYWPISGGHAIHRRSGAIGLHGVEAWPELDLGEAGGPAGRAHRHLEHWQHRRVPVDELIRSRLV